ncbi:MAG: hypothetical protein QOD99_2963 [Chthoniobacter sp.]|jgi:hypothetical protein|nr:hypothetical protein [Chthoniobacter sp.]
MRQVTCQTILLLLLCCRLSTASAEKPSLDALIAGSDLWTTKKAEFMTRSAQFGFRWTSNAQEAAASRLPGLTLFNIPVYETVARFDGDSLKTIIVSIYNRGDAGDLPEEKFQALLKASVDGVSTFTKAKPALRGKDASNAVHAEGVVWQNATTRFLLEYSFTREIKSRNIPYRAEFLRLEISPIEKPKSLLVESLAATHATHFEGVTHVKKESSGDVRLDGIPMVDQGQKGYCVVASSERVMRYYGSKVDEHELAEMANSSATGGTSNEAMFEALKKLSNRLRVKIRTLENSEVGDILKLVADYNRAARLNHAAALPPVGHTIDVMELYKQMKPDILREARTKNPSAMLRFQREIQSHIDQGLPLLWSVILGIVPEEKAPQGIGGHMRLIIGYNAKSAEVLYSDSWGLGHELKRMTLADAWTITTQLNTIEPL